MQDDEPNDLNLLMDSTTVSQWTDAMYEFKISEYRRIRALREAGVRVRRPKRGEDQGSVIDLLDAIMAAPEKPVTKTIANPSRR